MGLTGIRLGARRVAAFRRNCNCNGCRIAGAGEKRVRTRTLASLAISDDGERWTLINASPNLRAQIQNNRQLHQRGSIRASPIEGSGAHRRGDRSDRRRASASVSARHSP
jgi:pyrroloquinoline quinone biosynthesis protein B